MYGEDDREGESPGNFNCSVLFPTTERDTKKKMKEHDWAFELVSIPAD